MGKFDEQTLVSETIADLEESLARLTAERDELDRRIEEKVVRLNKWRLKLKQINTGQDESHRLAKGEALTKINEYFGKRPTGAPGLTMPEIAKATEVPWSSVRNVLKKKENGFFEKNGFWFKWKSSEDGLLNGQDDDEVVPTARK
jgi:hypothetical protein